MARILISTTGTLGDRYPFTALGATLRDRGHQITFAVERSFATWLTTQGFATQVLTGDIEETFQAIAPTLRTTTSPVTTIRQLLDHYLIPTLAPRVHELRTACQEADILVSSNVQLASTLVAELSHIPYVSVALTPAVVPDPAFAPLPYQRPHAPQVRHLINRLGWNIGRSALRRQADPSINQVRHQFGLPASHDLMFDGGLSRQLTGIAVSPAMLPDDVHWPTYVRATGFCFWDQDEWQEPEALTAFLAAPDPVIAISLGSISPLTGQLYTSLYRTSIAAIHAARARALVIGAPPEVLPEPSADVFSLTYAPHARIFPRCAAVIHHGGIGTAAQVWRAGIPALVVPGGVDQFITASLGLERGIGRWQRREGFSVPRVQDHLQVLLSDSTLRAKAQAIGERIQREHGAETLAQAIEQAMNL